MSIDANGVEGGKVGLSPEDDTTNTSNSQDHYPFTKKDIPAIVGFLSLGALLVWLQFLMMESNSDGNMNPAKWKNTVAPVPGIIFCISMPVFFAILTFGRLKKRIIAIGAVVLFSVGMVTLATYYSGDSVREAWMKDAYNYEVVKYHSGTAVEVKDLKTGITEIVKVDFVDEKVYLSKDSEDLKSQMEADRK